MKKTALIGHTGFVGSHLLNQYPFTTVFNSTNIQTIAGQDFDLVVCAGVSAVKWWANQHPDEDRMKITHLLDQLKTIRTHTFILISTVDVYPSTTDVDETFDCQKKVNHAYGKNRLYVEDTIRALFPQAIIIRLAGLFGRGLKKNVIYDLLHDNCLEVINPHSVFQWYYLNNLWQDIETVQSKNIKLVNLVNEPVQTADIIERFFKNKPVGAQKGTPISYNIRTCYSELLGGKNGYLQDKETVLTQIGQFIQRV
jgi:dTDP-4-dehydrorhamnose reductase